MSRNPHYKMFNASHLPEIPILRSIYEFAVPSFVETYQEGYPVETLQNYAQEHFAPARILGELQDSESLLLADLDHHQCLGFVYINVHSVPQIELPEACPEIQRFYVRPEARGSGLGSCLVANAEREILRRGWKGIWLDVWKFNIDARRFYECHG